MTLPEYVLKVTAFTPDRLKTLLSLAAVPMDQTMEWVKVVLAYNLMRPYVNEVNNITTLKTIREKLGSLLDLKMIAVVNRCLAQAVLGSSMGVIVHLTTHEVYGDDSEEIKGLEPLECHFLNVDAAIQRISRDYEVSQAPAQHSEVDPEVTQPSVPAPS